MPTPRPARGDAWRSSTQFDRAGWTDGAHPQFPKGRVRNYCTFTKVDLEARCLVERLPRVSPQRIVRWRDG